MFKRTIAAAIGLLAILAGVVAVLLFFGFLADTFQDPRNNPLKIAIPVDLAILLMGCCAIALGAKFISCGWDDPIDWRSSWVRPILLGLGLFFPGLVFSIPLGAFLSSRFWPGDNDGPFVISAWIGVATALISSATLLTKHYLARRNRIPPPNNLSTPSLPSSGRSSRSLP